MFNLHEEIKNWKKSLKKHKGFEEGYIEELYSHLLDNIDVLMSRGMNEKEAFEKAVEELGFTDKISKDFSKNNLSKTAYISQTSSKYSPLLLASYVKIGVRNILKHKGYSLINVLGLAFSLALVIILGLIIEEETSFDQFHTHKDRIYRVYTKTERNGEEFLMAPVTIPFTPAAKAEFAEIEEAVRVKYDFSVVEKDDKKFNDSFLYVDDAFFKMFSFNLISGDENSVLSKPFQVAISQKYSEKYFGKENPYGKTLLIKKIPYKITGVFEDMPTTSHFTSDILISFATYEEMPKDYEPGWGDTGNDYAYLLLHKNTNPNELVNKFPQLVEKHAGDEQTKRTQFLLQKLEDVHYSELSYDNARVIPKLVIIIFGAISIFILLIACVNFINLSTARATERAKEVGLRKVTGANRFQLMRQFLIECIVVSSIALLFALIIVKFILPEVNVLLRKSLDFYSIFTFSGILKLIGLCLVTGLLAGFYPALSLSKFNPVVVLKSGINQNVKGVKLRSILVVSQFIISVVLIICNFTIFQQIDFMKNKDLGFNSNDILIVYVNDPQVRKNITSFRDEFRSSKYFFNASISSGTPFSGSTSVSNYSSVNSASEDDVYLQRLDVDEYFNETYKILINNGRFFNKEISTDHSEACLVNQAAVRQFGWENPLFKEITQGGSGNKYKVIGVINDFHYSSAKNEIAPAVFFFSDANPFFLSLRVNPSYMDEGVKFLKEKYENYAAMYPLEYHKIQDRMESHYRTESRIFKFLSGCTVLALIISCLGILGLVSYTVNRRKKELGIRKILGATGGQLFRNISMEFLKWIVISNLIAWPIAYLFMQSWLENYSYRIEFDYFVFILAALITFSITFGTISYQSIKAVRENPVESLRYE